MVDFTILLSVTLSAIGSLLVSFLSLRDRLDKEREERYEREREEWKHRTAALCEQIEWELELLDNSIDVSNRKGGVSLGELSNEDDDALSHLDSLVEQLLEHDANRPPDIESGVSTQIREVVFAYLHPDIEPGEDVYMSDVRAAIDEPLHDLKDATRTGGSRG